MLAALSPDFDGVPIIIFWRPEIFQEAHHTFGHNIFYIFIAGIVIALLAKRHRPQMFLLGVAMVLLHYAIDLLTSAYYPTPFFWPLSNFQYDLPTWFGGSNPDLELWNFWLNVVVQWTLKICLISSTVQILRKHHRTFLELISPKLDQFLIDFAILPFQKQCDVPDCTNRAHYRCKDCKSVRCIRHSKINRDLTISCGDCAKQPPPD